MKKFLVLLLSILTLACDNVSDDTIHYSITQLTKDNDALLNIKLKVRAGDEGETILLFQDKAWGQDSLHNVLNSMRVLNTEATISTQRDSGWIVIDHPKNSKELEFEYTIKQDTEGELTTIQTYRPIVQPEYFHVFSHSLLMLPKHIVRPEGNTFNVNISWEGYDEDFALINSFGSGEKFQLIENITEQKLHSAAFLGGDLRIHELDIEENQVVFAIRGQWEAFEDSTLTAIIEKTVQSQRNLWQDHSQKYFAITMIPTFLERGSGYQGTGLTQSFAVNATNNEFLEIEGLVYLFNHELQHNWTGHIIKNADEEKQYWFSEGFTDYYTFKNITKEKIYNLGESYFIKELNTVIKEFFTNPVKDMPNKDLNYDNFWSGQEGVQKLPYRRGALFAFYLDNKINQHSKGQKSLDDVLIKIKNDAIRDNQKLTHPYFIKTINSYLDEDIEPFFNRHIENGKLYNLEQMFDEFGYEYELKAEVFDLGFEFSEGRRQVAKIDTSSNAFKAGLKEGDTIKGISYYRSPDYPAQFIVLRNGKELEIEYLPTKLTDIPQLKDNENNKSKIAQLY